MNRGEKRFLWILAVFIVVCMITSFVRAASAEYVTREVVVQEGDTLWSLWEAYGYGRADKWIYEVKELNNKETASLWPHERLRVPVMRGD